MKYLKKFNEGAVFGGLKQFKANDLVDTLTDILTYDVSDANIGRGSDKEGKSDDFLYKVEKYSNSSSMRDISISEVFRIDVRFWKNGNYFNFNDFKTLKPIFDRLISTMDEFSKSVDLIVSYWDDNSSNQYFSLSYDKMIEHLYKFSKSENLVD